MSEHGKFASCVYMNKQGIITSEFEYICLYKDIHHDRVYEEFILYTKGLLSSSMGKSNILKPLVGDVNFLSSYQQFSMDKGIIDDLHMITGIP